MTKPFNLADAKLGHPVQTVSGRAAILLKFDGRQPGYPIIGVHGDEDSLADWSETGFFGNLVRDDLNLVMAPLGQVDDRDVYPGDMLCFNGEVATSPVPYGVPFRADEWKWPHSYPVTRMSAGDIQRCYLDVPAGISSYFAAANEAIKHGIDNCYLFDAREFDSFTQSDGSPSTPADIVQAMRSLMESNDALRSELNASKYLRDIAVVKVGIDQGWKEAYDGLYGPGSPRPPAIPRRDQQYIALLNKAGI